MKTMKHMFKRLTCLIRGHDWKTVDLIKDPYEPEPLWIQFNCSRCGDFKVGIFSKNLVERMTKKKN